MGRSRFEEMMPAPTEALPAAEVPVSTEDLFAKRPRTKKDWVKKGRASKGSTESPVASVSTSRASKRKAPPPATEDLPPTQKLPEPQEAPAQKLCEEVVAPTQQLAEELLPATQLAQDMPATQLAQETASEHSPEDWPGSAEAERSPELSPTQRPWADVEVVYGKSKRRRVKTSEGPPPAVGKVKAIPSFAAPKPRRSSGMSFQDFVAMGKLKRGDPPEPEADPNAEAALSDGSAPESDPVKDLSPPQKLLEEPLPPTQMLMEEALPATQMLREDSLAATQRVVQDEPVATEKLDQEAPVATEKLEEAVDLHALLQDQIAELQEVSVQMTQRQKALVAVYKALQAMLR